MKLDRFSMILWSLLATAIGGAVTGLLLMQNPAMSAIHMRLSDVQSCIEMYGTLTCDFHHVIGGRTFAMFAAGALVAMFCALPTVVRFTLQFSQARNIRPGFSTGAGFCAGAIAYVALNCLGMAGGFLFADVITICVLGMLSGFYAWLACSACARASLTAANNRTLSCACPSVRP